MLHSIVLFAAAMALLFAAAHDVAVRTVPNRVSLMVAAIGLALNGLDGQLTAALFGAVLVFAATWFCWRKDWLGGGDVKLLTACVLLVPPGSIPEMILSTALAGGVLALIYMALTRLVAVGAAFGQTKVGNGSVARYSGARRANLIRRIWRAERRRIQRNPSLPYSCAIAAGVLLTLYVPFG